MRRSILGAGSQGRVVLEAWRAQHPGDDFVFLDDNVQLHGTVVLGAPVVGSLSSFDGLGEIVLAIGNNLVRLDMGACLQSRGVTFGVVIHPTAFVSPSATISEGAVVLPGARVHTEAFLGKHVVVNTGAIVEHDSIIEDGVSISPGVAMGGRVHVGRGAFISTGATLAARSHVGESAIIGAGAVVVGAIGCKLLAYGAPARPIREINQTVDFASVL